MALFMHLAFILSGRISWEAFTKNVLAIRNGKKKYTNHKVYVDRDIKEDLLQFQQLPF